MAVYLDRKTGELLNEEIYELGKLNWLYTNSLGTLARNLFVTKPAFSKLYGRRMRRPESVALIPDFIKVNKIDLEDFIVDDWSSFTEFFIREPKPEARPREEDPYRLPSPADARLSLVHISEERKFTLKGFTYTLAELLGDDESPVAFSGGLALIFRLTVADCHRYYFIDDCSIEEEPLVIPGRLHTVGPVADGRVAVLRENTRVVTFLDSKHFGRVAMIEIAALTIGSIVNHDRINARRGDEKGWFEPGGSTIVLLFQAGRIDVDADIMEAARQGIEVKVLIGEGIATHTTRLHQRGDARS